ncbi:two-component response regulator-like PRR73 isoform X3 [Coffea arabica]|uniref:Two-component response regulator-like PRR73 isoform X3 n=2 Tax=Coffea arabica TaxID=13443 RepID=A0ABM4UT51_COFAR
MATADFIGTKCELGKAMHTFIGFISCSYRPRNSVVTEDGFQLFPEPKRTPPPLAAQNYSKAHERMLEEIASIKLSAMVIACDRHWITLPVSLQLKEMSLPVHQESQESRCNRRIEAQQISRSVPMAADDANEEKDSLDEKGVRDGGVDVGQSSVKNKGLKVDGAVNDGVGAELRGQEILHLQQQQSPGTAVGWERFLHITSIKVLLVENDDSTRHVVTALLRNCNYEVVEAANGLQAWKILEDLTNQVDLVLTEVVMPCLSGIGLLCKIMSHRTRNNIPVIMTSSHDSMGLVFKCLSKGAVDFLVKPIRKNELKNLWQHVWRRCHSSSGSGSESGAQTQKSVHTKSSEKSDNSGSNDGENDGSHGLTHGDGSDDASGTQSSWTKQPIEDDSSQAASPICHVAECPSSLHAHVNRPIAESSSNKRVHITAKMEDQEEEKSVYKDPFPGTPNNLETEPENPIDIVPQIRNAKQHILLEIPSIYSSARINRGQANPTDKLRSNMHSVVNIEISHPQLRDRELEPPTEFANKLEVNGSDDGKEAAIELSLKQLRGIINAGNTIQDNHSPLKHSELSAFSRYNTSSSTVRAPIGITGSSYVIDNSQEVAKRDTVCEHSNGNLICPSSKVVSSNIDMGSTTNKFALNPLFFTSEATSAINILHRTSAFTIVKTDQVNAPQPTNQLKATDMHASSMLSPARAMQHHPHHHHYYHHHHHHHFHKSLELSNHDQESVKKLTVDTQHCGSSNVLGAPGDGDPANLRLNRSTSGSNYGSNAQNSAAMNAEPTNGESDMDLGGTNGIRDANGSGCENRVENKLVPREAALLKFRQKRKERCFKKKVRYQNRKRLAEQRPRVQGQFVRQTDHNNSNE